MGLRGDEQKDALEGTRRSRPKPTHYFQIAVFFPPRILAASSCVPFFHPDLFFVNSSPLFPYCPDLYHYARRLTRVVTVGKVAIGGDNPVRVQSMLTSDTRDTESCVQEALGLVAAGCEIVRITAQTRVFAANLENIKAGLLAAGCDVPLVADIHFKPDAAMEAAKWVEKVRVNPGNFVDKKKFEIREYSDSQYAEEL